MPYRQALGQVEKLLMLSLTLATLTAYWQVRSCRFVNYDDHIYVSHNPQAARVLAATLDAMGYRERSLAVFGMLADKDIAGVVRELGARVDQWRVAPLPGPRGAPAQRLVDELTRAGVPREHVHSHADIATALAAVRSIAGEADRIVVFGSFLTVAAALTAESSFCWAIWSFNSFSN